MAATAPVAAVSSRHLSVSVAFVSVSVTSLLGLELSTATDGDGFVWVGEIRRTAAVKAGGGSGPLLALELSAVMDGDGLTVAMCHSGSGVGAAEVALPCADRSLVILSAFSVLVGSVWRLLERRRK